jgi:integrase
MRGSIRKRYEDSWNIILDVGYLVDPDTGKPKRVQKWFTVKGTKRDAEWKLTELLHHLHRGEYVEPSRLTVGEWLIEWLETAIKPPNKRLRTYETYQSVIERHLQPALGTSGCNSSNQPTSSGTITTRRCRRPHWSSTRLSYTVR